MFIPERLVELNFTSVLLRLVLAMIAGGIIGLERTYKRQAAGFRTFMVTSLGAALTMTFALYEYNMLHGAWEEIAEATGLAIDISRLSAQVINGIGFLSVGMILITGQQQVSGITTASSLLVAACMGIAAGAGFYALVIVVFPMTFLAIRVLPKIEERIQERTRNINLFIAFDKMEHLGTILIKFKNLGIQVFDIDIEKSGGEYNVPSAVFSLRAKKRFFHSELISDVASLSCIRAIKEI